MVSKLTIPLLGTVPDHHAELISPLLAGSCASPVSPLLEPVVLTGRPPRKTRLAKVSFTLLVFLLFFLSVITWVSCTDARKFHLVSKSL